MPGRAMRAGLVMPSGQGAPADYIDRGRHTGYQQGTGEHQRPHSLYQTLEEPFPHGCHPTSSMSPGRGIPGWSFNSTAPDGRGQWLDFNARPALFWQVEQG
ncbi:hypothetical protein ARTHROSP310_14880 [Arthrobacter sp. AD-310]